jgi:hypothetical protein
LTKTHGSVFFCLTWVFVEPPESKEGSPQFATDPNGPNVETTLQSIRRYVARAEELVLAAAKGDFPGESRMGSRDRPR